MPNSKEASGNPVFQKTIEPAMKIALWLLFSQHLLKKLTKYSFTGGIITKHILAGWVFHEIRKVKIR